MQIAAKKTQKLSDIINTALTEEQCIKTTKADIQTVNNCIHVPTFLITRGLEALTRMLFFKFLVIIIGFCVKSDVQ